MRSTGFSSVLVTLPRFDGYPVEVEPKRSRTTTSP
jgi:hypothetical protein